MESSANTENEQRKCLLNHLCCEELLSENLTLKLYRNEIEREYKNLAAFCASILQELQSERR